jgi:outer membrane lipoprotein-sorting protein
MKTGILSITLLLSLPPAVAGQTTDEIVQKAIEARGGVAKLKAVQSERITGRITFAQGEEGVFVVELKRPLKMHVEISVEGQKIIRVYDGKSSGWMVNPFLESKDAQPMTPEDLKNIADESDFDGPLMDYKTKGNQIELVGKESLDDKPVYRLKLTNKNGDVRSYFLDAASFLVVKWEGVRKTGEQELPWESYFSDFQEVHGLRFPFRIDQGSPGTEVKQTLTAEKIEIDPQIDDSRFGKPVPMDPPVAPAPAVAPAPPAPNPPRP